MRKVVLRAGLRGGLTGVLALALVVGPLAVGALPQSFEDEVANLKSPTPKTRQQAARALGQSRRAAAVAPLSALVRDPDPDVRLEVVLALRELRDLSAVPALVTSLQDGDPKVREQAIGALVEMYSERERSGAVARFLQSFSDEFTRPSVPPYTTVDPAVFQGLAGTLRDEETHLRAESAQAIGILGGTSVASDLVMALQDPEADVRGAAATALVKVGTAEDGKALIPLLADESSQVRNRAIEAIGILRVREAGPALRELYEQHKRRALGTRVLSAMSLTGDPSQADLYRELLGSTDPERRRLAVEGLARISDPATLPGFKKDFQREGNTDVQLAYNFAIALLGDRAFIDSIVLNLSASGRRGERMRDYLVELGPSFTEDLYPYLGDQDAGVRAALADVLAEFGDPAAIDRLTPLLNDPNSEVADSANRAIQRLQRVARATSLDQ
ncbi:MAG: HEAT repeat domain-containing protein [Acidobacteria bacterium]|nr:HEAT repeat domain-containing protein [Acidobacteriota bacterium]